MSSISRDQGLDETMWSPTEIKAQLLLKQISHAQLAEECGVSRPVLSAVLTKTQFVLPKLIAILGENPFAVDEVELANIINKEEYEKKTK